MQIDPDDFESGRVGPLHRFQGARECPPIRERAAVGWEWGNGSKCREARRKLISQGFGQGRPNSRDRSQPFRLERFGRHEDAVP
jgi:hypothetical protein